MNLSILSAVPERANDVKVEGVEGLMHSPNLDELRMDTLIASDSLVTNSVIRGKHTRTCDHSIFENVPRELLHLCNNYTLVCR